MKATRKFSVANPSHSNIGVWEMTLTSPSRCRADRIIDQLTKIEVNNLLFVDRERLYTHRNN